ncbi:MAG: ThiF family adenylyltransferase, partial [Rhodocyclaceae bacterium]|nr:ThiF family adenylyltransferase [Rhodocyclaceae bacterium]
MDDEQLLRYSRHLLLPEIDIDGQEKWRQARILIIGAGGLGSAAGAYLAASGIGTLVLCDDDRVELSNLQRQILHNTERIGRLKVESARDTLAALNPDVNIHTHAARLSADALLEEARRADLILDCSDNFATRHAINRA